MLRLKVKNMVRIILLDKLWNRDKGEIMTVTESQAEFAVRKNKAEIIDESIIKPQFAPENKAEKKPLKNKGNAN